jgi:hypothetical protein
VAEPWQSLGRAWQNANSLTFLLAVAVAVDGNAVAEQMADLAEPFFLMFLYGFSAHFCPAWQNYSSPQTASFLLVTTNRCPLGLTYPCSTSSFRAR